MRALKYLSVFSLPVMAGIGFSQLGWYTFLPLLYAFGVVPGLELFLSKDTSNADALEEEALLSDRLYDFILYLVVPVQYGFLVWFALIVINQPLETYEWVGLITGMGVLCGAMAINVAHELGHRQYRFEQFLAKTLLLSSLYMHFFIEHNRGHHSNVATPEDPSSARLNEPVYIFWFRSTVFAYLHAWKLEAQRLKVQGKPIFSVYNEMLRFQVIQFIYLALFYAWGGIPVLLAVAGAGVFGFLLLETVNYIEHYGLLRAKKNERRYEMVRPMHSWNSNHPFGRLLLFELSRHSDHHFKADRKYQILRHHEESLQMPTGYPGMMLLSLIPPVFFKVVNPIIEAEFRKPQA